MFTQKDLTKPERKIPKSLLPFFSISQFICGAEFGFALHFDEKYQTFIKRFTLVISLVMIIILVIPLTIVNALWYWVGLIEFLLYFFISRLVKHTPCDVILAIQDIGDDRSDSGLGITVFIYTSAMMILKTVFGVLRCINDELVKDPYCRYISRVVYVLYHLPNLCVDLNSVVRIIIFYLINSKVKQLKDKLKHSEISLNCFLRQYMEIADCYDKSTKFLGYCLIAELLTGVPKLLATSWYMLLHLKQSVHWSIYVCEVLYILHMILQTLLPAIVGEMVATQVDRIKLLLSERIAIGTDEKTISETGRVLQYVEKRRLRHEVLRVLPLDIRLPTALFSVCATYFIVLIQFTHLYD